MNKVRIDMEGDERLLPDQIIKIVDDFKANIRPQFIEEEEYYKGRNVYVSSRGLNNDDPTIPNWEIPVTYGRKIVKTISGYMYKPGDITYEIESQNDNDNLTSIFNNNVEPVLNNKLGAYQATNGVVYELHYIEGDQNSNDVNYKMTMVKAADGIPIYNYDLEPKLISFIRIYERNGHDRYEVYSDIDIIIYERFTDKRTKKSELVLIDKHVNLFGEIPIIVIENNENCIGDISPVKNLIDAYDILMSDSMNEFDRFSLAYLKIVGSSIDPEDEEQIKKRRIFENLENSDAVSFLTKEIPTGFIDKMSMWIKNEIHKQSFIPDIDDLKFSGAASGVAISKFLYIMEYTAVDKEAYFRIALHNRLKLINTIIPIEDIDSIKITFTRNEPSSDLQNADIYVKLDGRGISRESLMHKYMPWIEDPQSELEKFQEEQESFIGVDLETEDQIEETEDGNEPEQVTE